MAIDCKGAHFPLGQKTHRLKLRETISYIGCPLAASGEIQSATNTARD